MSQNSSGISLVPIPAPLSVPIIVFLAAISCAIVSETSLICFLVYKRTSLRTYTNGFVVSLCISDFFVATAFLPGYISSPYHQMNGYLTAIILNVNVANLLALTGERYLACTRPLQYKVLISKHFFKLILSTWLIPIPFALIPLFFHDLSPAVGDLAMRIYLTLLTLTFVIIPYILIICIYTQIFKIVKVRSKSLVRLGVTSSHILNSRIKERSSISKMEGSRNYPDGGSTRDKNSLKKINENAHEEYSTDSSSGHSKHGQTPLKGILKKGVSTGNGQDTLIPANESTSVPHRPHHHRKSTCSRRKQEIKQIRGEWKVAKVFGIVIICFAMGWFPVVLATVLFVIDKGTFFVVYSRPYSIASIFTLSLTSVINGLLYAFMKEDFRKSLKSMLKKSGKKKKNSTSCTWRTNNGNANTSFISIESSV